MSWDLKTRLTSLYKPLAQCLLCVSFEHVLVFKTLKLSQAGHVAESQATTMSGVPGHVF